MKKDKSIQKQTTDTPRTHIPDFEIIDLEQDENNAAEEKQETPSHGFFKRHFRPTANTQQETPAPNKPEKSAPIQSEPEHAKPAAPQTVQSKIVQTKPAAAQTVQNKTVQATTAAPQTVQSKTVLTKPAAPQTVQSKTVQTKPAAPQTVQNKTVQATTAAPQTVQNKTVQATTAAPQTVQNKTVQTKPATAQTVQNKTVQATTAAPQTVQSKTVQTKPAAPQTVQNKTVQATTAAPQTVQSKTVQAKPAAPQTVQSKIVQTKPAAAQTVQNKTVQATTAVPQTVQTKTVQTKPAQSQNVQAPEPEQPKSVQPEPKACKPMKIESTWEEPTDTLDIRAEDLHVPNKKKQFNFSALHPYFNTHILLLAVFIIFVVSIAVKFMNWGERIDLSEIEHDNSGTYLDVLDQILPLTDRDGKPVSTGKVDTILAFGNAPFADDRDSKDNLANMIAESTGATVYNCSVSGSYLAAQHPFFNAAVAPMDAYSFYWLVTLAVGGANAHNYTEAANALGEDTPPEAQEVYDTLTTLDLNTVDVITIMYDASDYLMGHQMYSDENATDIQQFTGNLEAGIELLQDNYPNIRIIVMSPTYAYAVDENGDYVSSDMYRYGQDVLSTYVIKEYASCASRSVSFIDHLYGTITEANASDYLIDNLHLNTAGRKLVAERFLKVLNYYNK